MRSEIVVMVPEQWGRIRLAWAWLLSRALWLAGAKLRITYIWARRR